MRGLNDIPGGFWDINQDLLFILKFIGLENVISWPCTCLVLCYNPGLDIVHRVCPFRLVGSDSVYSSAAKWEELFRK